MIIKQLSIFVENTKGRLADIADILAKENIDIRALCVADTKDFGILRLIVNDPEKAAVILKESHCTVALTEVLTIKIEDKPGGLAKPIRILSDHGINVEYMYAFVSKEFDSAFVILRVEDNEAAIKVLSDAGVTLVSSKEIYDM